jgi:hypothetical protein
MAHDNETWIIEEGNAVIERRAALGVEAQEPLDRLIYCLWVADYGMRNAGDLETASDLYDAFQDEAARLSHALSMPFTHAAFTLPRLELEQRYFTLFDGICDEIRAVQGEG